MSAATTGAVGTIVLAGDLTGSATSPVLIPSGVVPGTIRPNNVWIDSKGRILKVNTLSDAQLTALSVAIPDATTSSLGKVQIGTNIGVSAGVISIPDATDTVKGVLKVTNGNGLDLTAGTLSSTLVNANGAGTTGIVFQGSSGYISIVNGALDLVNPPAFLSFNNTFSKSQATALTTQTFAASFTPDFLDSNIITTTLTSNITTLNLPTNTVDGGVYSIILNQDATGSRTLSGINGSYKNNETITLSTTANSIDILTIIRISSTEFILILTNNW